jgi:DnaJ-class molecular chaperone
MSTLKDRVSQTYLDQEPPVGSPAEPSANGGIIADFQTLGLRPTASLREIDTSYRELAKQLHPDSHPGIDISRIKRVNEAYARLRKLARSITDKRSG